MPLYGGCFARGNAHHEPVVVGDVHEAKLSAVERQGADGPARERLGHVGHTSYAQLLLASPPSHQHTPDLAGVLRRLREPTPPRLSPALIRDPWPWTGQAHRVRDQPRCWDGVAAGGPIFCVDPGPPPVRPALVAPVRGWSPGARPVPGSSRPPHCPAVGGRPNSWGLPRGRFDSKAHLERHGPAGDCRSQQLDRQSIRSSGEAMNAPVILGEVRSGSFQELVLHPHFAELTFDLA